MGVVALALALGVVALLTSLVKSTFLQVVDLTTFKAAVESDYIGTGDSHNLASSQGLLYLYLEGVMVIGRVSYGYGYTRGSGRRGSVGWLWLAVGL